MRHLPFTWYSRTDDLNNSFWENIHFGRVMVLYAVNQMIIQASIPPSSLYSIQPFLQNHGKYCNYSSAARNWINSATQTAAMTFAFPSVFMTLSFFYAWHTLFCFLRYYRKHVGKIFSFYSTRFVPFTVLYIRVSSLPVSHLFHRSHLHTVKQKKDL